MVLLASPILFIEEENFSWSNVVNPLKIMVPLFILFLINRFILVPGLFLRKKNLLYFVSVGGIIAVFTLGTYFLDSPPDNSEPHRHMRNQGFSPPPPPPPPPERMNDDLPPLPGPKRGGPMPPYANFLIFSILLVGFDTGLRISFKLAKTQQEKTRLEKENIGTQLAFLRNQVSPHFFMNTLNNIHSLIDVDSDEAKESIIRLSKLMRHLLYESEIEKISILKEVDFVKNYVDLMKLRFSERVKINLHIPDKIPDKTIPPLLFTSYLENAFKHGISYQNSSFIDISFFFTKENMTFDIRNSNLSPESREEHSGIGIENSRKRLDLIFGENYSLEIEDAKEEYHVQLTIPLC